MAADDMLGVHETICCGYGVRPRALDSASIFQRLYRPAGQTAVLEARDPMGELRPQCMANDILKNGRLLLVWCSVLKSPVITDVWTGYWIGRRKSELRQRHHAMHGKKSSNRT